MSNNVTCNVTCFPIASAANVKFKCGEASVKNFTHFNAQCRRPK